jgi:hypothetical protein
MMICEMQVFCRAKLLLTMDVEIRAKAANGINYSEMIMIFGSKAVLIRKMLII